MTESEKKSKPVNSGELSTIQDGERFRDAYIPKVVDPNLALKESYPEGFNERSKRKHSARKSVRIHDSGSKSKGKSSKSTKKEGSASKSKIDSGKKSGKKSALK